jgi:hypothetical protein
MLAKNKPTYTSTESLQVLCDRSRFLLGLYHVVQLLLYMYKWYNGTVLN